MKKIILIVVMLLTGCASMFSGTKENFIIRSDDKEAKLYMNNEYLGQGVAAVTMSKKNLSKEISFSAKKKGCETTTRIVQTKIDPTTFLGCFIDFCIITVGVIDWRATGAIKEATQTSYNITPICN